MPFYSNADGYQAYIALTSLESLLPPYEMVNNKVIIYVGEVFCRFRTPNGRLCPFNKPFSSQTNLRAHIRRHHLDIHNSKCGIPNMDRQIKTLEWYSQFAKLLPPESLKRQVKSREVVNCSYGNTI